MSSSSPLLLIAFRSPPFSGVNARRQTKLARYLAEDDREVHVLTVRWIGDGPHALDELKHPNITIHRTPSLGPHLLEWRRPKGGLRGRVLVLWRGILNPILRHLGLDEDARFWGLVMVPRARRLIKKHDIRCVVATGPPFRTNWWAAKLRRTNPSIRLVQDFHDPWAAMPASIYAIARRHSPEVIRRLEAESLDPADLVVTVNEGYKRLLSTNTSTRVEVIPNGYDSREAPSPASADARPFTLVYAGTLGAGRREPALALINAVRTLSAEMPELRLDFWGPPNRVLLSHCADLLDSGVMRFHQQVSSSEIARVISQEAFACILFVARDMPENLPLKAYEYAYLRRPILSIDYGGGVRRLLSDHRIGMSAHGNEPEAIERALRMLYRLWRDEPSYQTEPIGLERYDYRRLNEEYAALLDELQNQFSAD